jgi:hypothetical protein
MTRRKQIDTEDLDALEAHLAGTLKRVSPPGDILQRLSERVQMLAPEKIASRLRDWRSLIFVFGGVMSGMVVIITVARALFYFFRRHTG